MKATERKVYVVDDHPIVREGIVRLVNREPDLEISGEGSTCGEALDALARELPDVVIADLSLEGRGGMELIKQIRSLYPDLPVLVLSMHDELVYGERALHAGANGYVMKRDATKTIISAIRTVLEGDIYLSEEVKTKVLRKMMGARGEQGADPIDRLTDRELEVFHLLGQGLSTREIAGKLCLSIKTIGVHRQNIKQKLGLSSAHEVVHRAMRWSR